MSIHTEAATVADRGLGQKAILPVFAATLFLSAFLLFSVQPLFAKMVLPKLGGSPGVWSVAMVFFQSVLLLGYAYSHVLISKLGHRTSVLVHGAMCVIALLALPIAIPQGWSTPPETGQSLWLIGLFAVSVGIPFFAVSANGPLLQAWFARSNHAHARDPYFLYGASNIGSFASLFLFILFFEPQFSVSVQNGMWMAGFALLSLSIGVCAALTWNVKDSDGAAGQGAIAETQAAPTWKQRLLWIVLALIPSGLMVAVTAHISTDIAAAPFLWVVPLALFLLTFVLAFQSRQMFPETKLRTATWVLGIAVLVTLYLKLQLPLPVTLGLQLAFFFVAALYCHTRLVDARPASRNLTEFYMFMSLGGVLGGIFASLFAMAVFDTILEYPLLIVAALMARKSIYDGDRKELLTALGIFGTLAVLIVAIKAVTGFSVLDGVGLLSLLISLLAVMAFGLRFRSEALGAMCLLMILPFAWLHSVAGVDKYTERTFFGVLSVEQSADGRYSLMKHGTTLHGAQQRLDENGVALVSRPVPVTYYHETGPLAGSLLAAQANQGGQLAEVGIVGLGTGSMVCYGKPGENWTTYEIDRSVVDMAMNPKHFTYMTACGVTPRNVVGDARITLADEPKAKFDYLLIDAFSSDSIPVHLLTREAVDLYMDKVAQGGMLVFHLSNRYMELQSVIAAIARERGLHALFHKEQPRSEIDLENFIVLGRAVALVRDPADFGTLASNPAWKPAEAGETIAWSDEYSNILAAIWRNYRQEN